MTGMILMRTWGTCSTFECPEEEYDEYVGEVKESLEVFRSRHMSSNSRSVFQKCFANVTVDWGITFGWESCLEKCCQSYGTLSHLSGIYYIPLKDGSAMQAVQSLADTLSKLEIRTRESCCILIRNICLMIVSSDYVSLD